MGEADCLYLGIDGTWGDVNCETSLTMMLVCQDYPDGKISFSPSPIRKKIEGARMLMMYRDVQGVQKLTLPF